MYERSSSPLWVRKEANPAHVLMTMLSFTTSAVATNHYSNRRALGAVNLYLFSSSLYSLQEFFYVLSNLSIFFYGDFQSILVFAPLLGTDACCLCTLLPGATMGQNYA